MKPLRCPWCGKKTRTMAIGTEKNDGYAVICDHPGCEAQGPIVATERIAIARWNHVVKRLGQ